MADQSTNSVLIVDDEAGILCMLERIFRGAGFVVGCGKNGVDGLKMFHQADWDVVIVDRGMPEMNGEEMAKRIKATHPDVPLILITGLPRAIIHPELYCAVLAKPFPPMELVGMVGKAIASRIRSEECR
jgi:two-component system cell cycle sensor histidine kinase/response regulator CckA